MKIMYCITSASWGGAQLHVLELCQYQIKMGNDVVFVVGSKGPLMDKVEDLAHVKVILLPSLHRELNLFYDVKAIFDIRKILLKERPDILHLHSSKAGTLGRLASMRLPMKVIFTVHGWAFTDGVSSKLKKELYVFVEKVVAPLTDLYICVSQFDFDIGIKRHVLKRKDNKAIVVHNGSPEPTSFDVKKKVLSDPLRIVMTARFSNQKNQKVLIEALSQLKDEHFIMTFVGDGPTLEENQKLVLKLGLGNKIKFVGFENDVGLYLRKSDVYVLSTNYEGLPISIIEAMSFGLPIIATDVGGNSELVDTKRNGLLVQTGIDDLVNALKYIFNNLDYMGSWSLNSYSKWEKEFRLEKQMKIIDDKYRMLYGK